MKDKCLNCGKEYEPQLWEATCNCKKPNVTHQLKCHGCESIIGVILDDDYCGFEKLYCPKCMNKN